MILCGPQFMIGAFVLTGVIWPEGCHIGFDGDKLQCFSEAEVKQATLVLTEPCAPKPSDQSPTEEAPILSVAPVTSPLSPERVSSCRLALADAGPVVR